MKLNRLPVRYKGSPLMPMKASRVKKFVDSRLGKIRYDRKIKVHYLQLMFSPSGKEIQQITIGLDPGSTFDGFSIVSKECHHLNIELIQRSKKGKTSIKAFKRRQRQNRRLRRSKLRHRPIRFSFRISKKLPPTIRANLEFRKWLILRIIRIFPISKMVVEDVRFNHFSKKGGKSFSHVEIGKTTLYNFIKNLGIGLELIQGFETHALRNNSFESDLKLKDKGSKHFNAHCLDSFVMACPRGFFSKETGELFENNKDGYVSIIKFNGRVNEKVLFIEKIVKIRRCLIQLKKMYLKEKFYYKRQKGDIKQIYQNISSHRNLCRVKLPGEHSNHPKVWIYLNYGYTEKFKCHKTNYGGTRINGKTFFRNGEWLNRRYSY